MGASGPVSLVLILPSVTQVSLIWHFLVAFSERLLSDLVLFEVEVLLTESNLANFWEI